MSKSNKSLLIGITGGIGVGKSTVASVFKTLGIPVYDADSRAKWLMINSAALKIKITKIFGDETLVNGKLDRKYLASQVFNKPEKLERLNKLVHPAVAEDFKQWAQEQKSDYVLKEAALLFESNSYEELDAIIVVSAPLDIRIQRVLQRDKHRTESDVKNIIERQLPESVKLEKSDFIIFNDESSLVIPQVLNIHKLLLEQISG